MKIETLRSTPEPEKLVCQAARNDYSTMSLLEQNYPDLMSKAVGDTLQEQEERLQSKLMGDGHWGPYEHPQITIYLEGVSRIAMAQITRHRHASFDVQSLRYTGDQLKEIPEGTDLEDLFLNVPTLPKEDPAQEIMESYSDFSEVPEDLKKDAEMLRVYWESIKKSINAYDKLTEFGMPKEDARAVLPMATKVNIVMSVNARAAMHILNLRMKGNAQGEARDISKGVIRECKEWMPFSFNYYEEEVDPTKARIAP